MTIYPAIDLYQGKAVRLKRGDYGQMTTYSDDPVSVAQGFREAGASALHIVDLEGARDGKPANNGVITRIAAKPGLIIQVGGGIRTEADIGKYLEIGVRRVILGTAAVSKPGFLAEMVRIFGEAIAVSVDIKDGFAAIKGWTELSDKDALSFCRAVFDIGVKTLICTDISKDGLLEGTNMELYHALREASINWTSPRETSPRETSPQGEPKISLIASGGITSLEEVKALSKLGMDGAILGKALYTGDIDLAEAIAAAG